MGMGMGIGIGIGIAPADDQTTALTSSVFFWTDRVGNNGVARAAAAIRGIFR
jgi:hypothetical protein